MSGYKIIIIVVLVVIVASIYDLEPAIKQLVYTITDLPEFDVSDVKEPEVFSLAVRAMYLIALIGIIKLLVSGKKG
jgi:hypothetical protein